MPYRRLPNTDTARYKAIETAVNKSFSFHPIELPFSQKILLQLKSFLPTYKQALTIYKENVSQQKELSDLFHGNSKRLKLYVSHFIQVLNFAILRGEIKEKARSYFGLSEDATNLPLFKTDEDLVKWTEILINGEELRIREGGLAMSNPKIALVNIRYEDFKKTKNAYLVSKKSTKLAQEKVAKLRDKADELILELWNDIEANFSDGTADERRAKCSDLGVKYVYRPSER